MSLKEQIRKAKYRKTIKEWVYEKPKKIKPMSEEIREMGTPEKWYDWYQNNGGQNNE